MIKVRFEMSWGIRETLLDSKRVAGESLKVASWELHVIGLSATSLTKLSCGCDRLLARGHPDDFTSMSLPHLQTPPDALPRYVAWSRLVHVGGHTACIKQSRICTLTCLHGVKNAEYDASKCRVIPITLTPKMYLILTYFRQ